MDSKQFDYVLTVAEEKSFSKAAKKLFISQPSLSQYINRLEVSLGITLFDRSVSPLELTYEGQLYIETIMKIKNLLKELKKKYDDIADLKMGKINIGLTSSKALNPLPQILVEFKTKYPSVELTITEAASSELEDLLVKGLVDICLLNLPIQNKNIEYEEIKTERILLAAPPNFNIESNKSTKEFPKIDLKLLEKESFILLKPEQRIRQIANNIFKEAGFKPKILLETRSIETSLSLTAAGMGFSLVPESSISLAGFMQQPNYYTIGDEPLSWSLVVAHRSEAYRTMASMEFAKIAKRIVSDS